MRLHVIFVEGGRIGRGFVQDEQSGQGVSPKGRAAVLGVGAAGSLAAAREGDKRAIRSAFVHVAWRRSRFGTFDAEGSHESENHGTRSGCRDGAKRSAAIRARFVHGTSRVVSIADGSARREGAKRKPRPHRRGKRRFFALAEVTLPIESGP
jgi:hypothetical protein